MNLAEKIILILVGLFSIVSIVFVLNQQGVFNGPKSFAECSNAPGSRILEVYPPQCLWHGKIFVEDLDQPVAAENNQSDPGDGRGGVYETGDENVYANNSFGLKFNYPEDFVLWEERIDNAEEQLTVQIVHQNEDGRSISVNVIDQQLDPNRITGFYGLIAQDQVTQVAIGSQEWYNFTEGDAGCGGSVYQTAWLSKTLQFKFNDCEDGTNRTRLFTDKVLAEQVLATIIIE